MVLTIKELAEELGVSKTTIRNTINKLDIKLERKAANKQTFIITDEQAELIRSFLIGGVYTENLTAQTENSTAQTEQDSSQTENSTAQTDDQTKQTEKSAAQTDDHIRVLIEMLQEELRAKNKQIEDLSRALDQQQQLAAMDRQKILQLETRLEQKENPPAADIVEENNVIDEPAAAADQEPTKKKGFFARLFGM